MNGCLEICLLLIARGCDPTMRDGFGNNAAYWAKRNGYTDILKYLPAPVTLTPEDNKYYRDQVEETYLLIKPEDKKKIILVGKKFFKGLIEQYNKLYKSGLIKHKPSELFTVVDSEKELNGILK